MRSDQVRSRGIFFNKINPVSSVTCWAWERGDPGPGAGQAMESGVERMKPCMIGH